MLCRRFAIKVRAHLHLPKSKRGDDACISVAPFAYKPGQKTVYYGTVTMTNVKFKVSEPGRQRTLDTGVKNVHAWVVGDFLVGDEAQLPPGRPWDWRCARYNPKNGPHFVDSATGNPVFEARAAYMVGSKVFYIQ